MTTPTRELINALRDTRDRLADPMTIYSWGSVEHCNCGQLAQTLMGLDGVALWDQMLKEYSAGQVEYLAWTFTLPSVVLCPETGLPLSDIFRSLYKVGLTPEDIADLEHLGNLEVVREVNRRRHRQRHPDCKLEFTKRLDVQDYLGAWADLLEQQLGVTL